jgi:hypothetical protein
MGLFSDDDSGPNNARKAKKKANKKLKKAKKQIGKAKKESTEALRRAENKGTKALYGGQDKGIAALETGKTGAIESLTGARDQAREDLSAGRDQGLGYLQEALATGRGDIDTGAQGAMDQYQNALNLYEPLAAAAGQGAEKYGNFYGLGGQEGFNTAQAEFQASPLYQAMVGESSQGQQALDRQAAGRGNPYNAADTLKYQGDLAGRYVNDYTAGLRPYLDQQGQYAGAQSNIYGNMANTLYGAGGAKAGLAGQLGGAMGDMAYGAGQGLGGYAMNTGSNLSNVYTGTGANQSNVYTGTGANVSNLAQGIGTTQATGVNVPLAQTQAGLTAQQGQNEAAMYANIQAANNAQRANDTAMWGNILGAAGKVGASYVGAKA